MISISELTKGHGSLVRALEHYNYASVAPLVSAFLTLPEFHANTVRLDALAHLACYSCTGTRIANREMLVQCVGRHLADSPLTPHEDPVEDAFVGNVATTFGNFRVFRGIEESGDFWVEELSRVFEDTNLPAPLKSIVNHIHALLKLSDRVAERLQLSRYSFATSQPRGRIAIPQWRTLITSAKAVTFSPNDLKSLALSFDDISPFILSNENRKLLKEQSIGNSCLERYPLLNFGNDIILACPHVVTASIRRFAIEQIRTTPYFESFKRLLHNRQIERWVGILEHDFDFKLLEFTPPEPSQDVPPLYELVMNFDGGKYAHLVFLDGNIDGQTNGNFDSFTENQLVAFQDHLIFCAERIKKLPNYNAGMTLISRGGTGRGLLFGLKKIPEEWDINFIPLPDCYTLARCEDMSALRLWRMYKQKKWAEKHGLTIQNLNGPLNLYAAWRIYGWRFLHRQMPVDAPNKMLAVGIDFLTEVRKTVDQENDFHSCQTHDSLGWIRVQRRYPKKRSRNSETSSIYISPEFGSKGFLIGLIEKANCIWWFVTKTKPQNSGQGEAIFQIWDCVLNWMARAVRPIESKINNFLLKSVWVEIDFTDLAKWSDHSTQDLSTRTFTSPSFSIQKENSKITVTIPGDFKNAFHVPENNAEKILIKCIVMATAALADAKLSKEDLDRILLMVFPNNEARFFHVLATNSIVQKLAESDSPAPDFVADEDCAQSLLGVANEIGIIPKTGKIYGQTESLQYLEKAANKLWERVEAGLACFGRESVIRNCFLALAELEKDDDHWSMTARALLALKENESDMLLEARERHSKRDAAFLTNRLLIEIAMYACQQVSGPPLPRAERLEMLAHLKNLITIASHRDAISGGFMPPEINVFPNGEVDVDGGFYERVMIPYTTALFASGFQSLARGYESWFSNYERKSNSEIDTTLGLLAKPFQMEFGITLEEFILIKSKLEEYALRIRCLVFELSEQDFLSFLTSECGLNEGNAALFLDRFSLPPRRSWDKDLPVGCKVSDAWPWRFRRQLSLVMRPFILLSMKPHKRWLIYPPIVSKSCAYILYGLCEGVFSTEHFKSEAMLKFWGDQANRLGSQFMNDVADRAEQLGYSTRREIFMKTLGVPVSAGNFGDVDVLAWKQNSAIVFIIECKYLRTAKNVGDVIDRLIEYRGKRDDSLGKHLRRLNWLKSNPAAICAITGIPPTEIQLKGILVTDDLVPMQFFDGSPISPHDVISLNRLSKAMP